MSEKKNENGRFNIKELVSFMKKWINQTRSFRSTLITNAAEYVNVGHGDS